VSDRRELADWLRDAWNDPAAGCPPPEAYLEAELAAMTDEQRRRVEAHAETCTACAAERELARAFDQGEAGAASADVDWVVARMRGGAAEAPPAAASATVPAPATPASTSPSAAPRTTNGMRPGGTVVPLRGRRLAPVWTRLAAAAVLAIAAGLTLFTLRDRPPALPEPPRGGVVRGGEVVVEAPLGEVAEPPRELRWRTVPGAASYRVRILTVDETPLWDMRVTAPSAPIPAEVAARLHRAVSYDWMVEAAAPDGSTLARSATARFRIQPLPEPTRNERR